MSDIRRKHFWSEANRNSLFESVAPADSLHVTICLTPHQAKFEVNGRPILSGRVPRGGVGVRKPGDRIHVTGSGPCDVVLFFADFSVIETVCEEAGLPYSTRLADFRSPEFAANRELYDTATRIAAGIGSTDPFSSMRMDLAAQETIVHLLSSYSDIGNSLDANLIKATGRGLAPAQLRRAIEAMEATIDAEPALPYFAAAAGCSTSHFSRSFKVSTGFSPMEWLLHRKLDRAKELLLHSDRELVDIALAVGFAAQAQFTTAFKRVTGVTPGRWRTQAR